MLLIDSVVPLTLALIISMVEFISRKLNFKYKLHYRKIVSFAAGISITYILLELLPFFAENALEINKFLFLALLIGFVIHHIIEKEIYQHNSRHELVKKLTLEEHTFHFIYHIILGIVFIKIIQANKTEGLFFFISILAYTIASNLPTRQHRSNKVMALLASSTFIGALIAVFFLSKLQLWLEFSLVGFVTGVLLFTVTRHHIHHGKIGSVSYFTLGSIIYTFFILSKWLI